MLTFFAVSCIAAAMNVAAAHPAVWHQAGDPHVECAAPITDAGTYDYPTSTIFVRDGLTGYNRVIAHELGHLWLIHQKDPRRAIKYARIRGFTNPYSTETWEDYAETFVFALGEWSDIKTPPPYGFQTPAGLPTEDQIRRLRKAKVLPL